MNTCLNTSFRLDLGCGTGYWILKAAHEWTETEFVGKQSFEHFLHVLEVSLLARCFVSRFRPRADPTEPGACDGQVWGID
jgi:hypothetical protein